jgi:hypothetical protein
MEVHYIFSEVETELQSSNGYNKGPGIYPAR